MALLPTAQELAAWFQTTNGPEEIAHWLRDSASYYNQLNHHLDIHEASLTAEEKTARRNAFRVMLANPPQWGEYKEEIV